MTESEELLQLWGKKKGDPEVRYPLIFHLFDAAAVAGEMWQSLLQKGARRSCSQAIGLTQEQTGKLISFWVGIHDIGKATPAFRYQVEENRHDILTSYILINQFKFNKQLAVTIGGHHGVFPRSDELVSPKLKRDWGNKEYANIREKILFHLAKELGSDVLELPHLPQSQPFFMFLAGLTTVADWIASNEDFFPIADVEIDICAKYADSQEKALQALRQLYWSQWQSPIAPHSFSALFPFIKTIRPLQNSIIELAGNIKDSPGLVIIEAPMGEGKSEAAMYLSDFWNADLGQKGCYFALPTQATSNQMFKRFQDYLQRCYPDRIVNLLLLHGHAALSAEFELLKEKAEKAVVMERISINDNIKPYDGVSSGVVAGEWFTYRKRGLLSPFGVGTIDQSLLAVLQTRHVFVRLFGLANKTVIIDEVHAYDAYMSTLLERLLEWLAALGSSVVLLSATLPLNRRNDLMASYQRGLMSENALEFKNCAYPRISWITSHQTGALSIATSSQASRILNIRWVNGGLPDDSDEFELGKLLAQALVNGGCVAVICNTVDHAQKMYQALKPYFPNIADDGFPELDLLHARFLHGDRADREKRTLARFGKPGSKDAVEKAVQRPHRAILVATQIIEQSLDLDFDLMVSEMAPVDLLLQRSGRLQRHERPERPCFQSQPTLWICQTGEKQDGTPDFGGGTEAVYERHILLRSWLELKNRTSIAIPSEIEELIEKVYASRECPADLPGILKRDWQQSADNLVKAVEYEREEAETRWIKRPSFTGDIWKITADPREEDDPAFHPDHQALTRLAGLSVSVLCISEKILPDNREKLKQIYSGKVPPDNAMINILLQNSISLSQPSHKRGIVNAIMERAEKVPEIWRENPLLRHHYLLFFDQNNECSVDNYLVSLHQELGVVIQRNK